MPKPSQSYLKKIYKHATNFKTKKVKKNDCFSHHLFFAKKWKKGQKKSQWFAKYLGENRNEALAETLAQEAMRLILPQQPKTRRLIEITKDRKIKYFVLSKEISKFDEKFFSIPKNNELIANNRITGLAATQVLALWLNEVDFKPSNVGVDQDKKEVVKVDGGLSFVLLNPDYAYLHDRNFEISSVDLQALPNLISYQACNWLQHILWHDEGYALKKEPTSLDKDINQNPLFKAELYRTILRIISLPNQLIYFFTKSYIGNTEDIKKFSNFLITRKEQLALAAKKIHAFNEYCQSSVALEEMFEFLQYLKNFKTMEKYILLDAFEKKYNINIETAIWENILDDYTSIKKIFIDVDNYLKINLLTDTNQHIHDFISKLKFLKSNTAEFLNKPTVIKKNMLYKTMKTLVGRYEKNKNFYGSDLIRSMNEVVSQHNRLKKVKIPELTSIINFFNGDTKKQSIVNYEQHLPLPITPLGE